MQRGPAAERDHRVAPDDLAPLDGVDPGRVRHVLVHHLDYPDRRPLPFQPQRIADITRQRRRRALRIEPDPAACKPLRVQLAEHEVGVGHGRTPPTAPVAGGAGFGAGARGTDPEPVHRVHARDRSAARPDLHHFDDRDAHRQTAPLEVPVPPGDLEGAGSLGGPVPDEADLRGGAAHVQRERLLETASARHVAGQDRSAGGTRFDEPNRKAGRDLHRGDAAARHHQVERAGHSPRAQPFAQAQEIARHQGPDVGVRAGGREALVLPDLRADLARKAHGGFRELSRHDLADRLLVGRMGVGVQEPDRDRLDPRRPPCDRDLPHPRGVERNEDLPACRYPLVDLAPQRARHERLRLVHEDVVLLEPLLESHLEDVPEPSGGQERGPCPLAFDEGVRGEGGAVDEDVDVRRRGGALLQGPIEGFEHAGLGRARRGRDLGGAAPGRGVEDDVGKRAPDVGRETALAHHFASTAQRGFALHGTCDNPLIFG